MYLLRGADGFEIASLRQGDILAGIPFPLLDQSKMHLLGEVADDYDYAGLPEIAPKTHLHRTDTEWVTLQVPARFCMCAVLTNCCDLEPRNGRVPTQMVSLARLRPISPDIRRDPERFHSLQANKDPRDQQDAGYIGFFYLESHELLDNRDWVVQFDQVVGIPSTDIGLLLRKKIIQLDDRTRVKFKIKLGVTFLRINNEEIAAGLMNPWQEAAPPESSPNRPQQGNPQQNPE